MQVLMISDGSSQGGHIVFASDKFNMSCPVLWKSTKVLRVARSTLATETLAFAKGADTACFINQLGEELSLIPPTSQIPHTPTNPYTIALIPIARYWIIDYA